MHSKSWRIGAVLLAVASLVNASSAYALSFHLRDLGTLGGSTSYARGINDRGQVTGYSQIAGDTATHAFLFDGTQMLDLGAPPGGSSYGVDINNRGEITGSWHDANGRGLAFYYDGATITTVESLDGFGLGYTWGAAINDAGQIAYNMGYPWPSGGYAFVYENANYPYQGIPGLGGNFTNAEGINNLGQVTGISATEEGWLHAFLSGATGVIDLGTLNPGNYGSSVGLDINDLGHVTGTSERRRGEEWWQHAFLYDGTRMIDLGSLGMASTGHAINNRGQIVGWSELDGGLYHAFLYDTRLGGMVDLNDFIDPLSGWMLNEAYDINEHGQITGYGTYEGQERAFLLTPIPEPATILLLGAGIAGLLLRRIHASSSGRQN